MRAAAVTALIAAIKVAQDFATAWDRSGPERKKQLLAKAAGVFGSASKEPEAVDLGPLHKKIGQQALEIDFLERALTKAGLLSADK